jgi:hypothetical protein
MCGHSAIESAMSIKEVSDVMCIVLPEIENISETSNSGGGAAIQHTWLEVVLRVVAPKDSTINNCDHHGRNLPLKEALEDALGQPGIGHNSPWQLEFVAKLFLDQLKEIYGKAKVDEMWSSQSQVPKGRDAAWWKVLLQVLR